MLPSSDDNITFYRALIFIIIFIEILEFESNHMKIKTYHLPHISPDPVTFIIDHHNWCTKQPKGNKYVNTQSSTLIDHQAHHFC